MGRGAVPGEGSVESPVLFSHCVCWLGRKRCQVQCSSNLSLAITVKEILEASTDVPLQQAGSERKDAGDEILPSLEGRRGPEELPGEKLGSAFVGRDGGGMILCWWWGLGRLLEKGPGLCPMIACRVWTPPHISPFPSCCTAPGVTAGSQQLRAGTSAPSLTQPGREERLLKYIPRAKPGQK